MKAMGIIFSNVYDDNFGELTNKRTVASLPFGGRYRQIDFVLSNLSNSGICQVGVITKYNYRSLMDHLGSCVEWDLNRKNEGLVLLPPFASGNTGVYRGKLEALYSAVGFINNPAYDYVVLSDSTVLCNIDYRPIIREHIKSGADVTAVAIKAGDETGRQSLLMYADESGTVTDLEINAIPRTGAYDGLGMFVISRPLLAKVVEESYSKGYIHLEREFIQRRFNEGTLSIHLYGFDGVVLRNTDIAQYFANSMKMLSDESIRRGLFDPARPIYTKVRDEYPSYYSETSELHDCLVADGCTLRGYAEHSVLFRSVTLDENAQVRNSIVMQGTRIGRGAHLDCVILDKNVTVSDGMVLKGTPTHPVIIPKGARV